MPVTVGEGETLHLSPGEHSELIRDIVENFGERFAPGGVLIYAGDTGAGIATSTVRRSLPRSG